MLPCVCTEWSGCRSPNCLHGTVEPTGVEGAPKLLIGSIMRNVEPPYLWPENGAGETVRHTAGDAGLRCRRKRRPFCNGVDTGLNVTRLEREQTSDGWLIAGKFGESLLTGKQMIAPQVCAACLEQLSRDRKSVLQKCLFNGTGYPHKGLPLNCLSRMTRKCHVRFLGGLGRKPLSLPDRVALAAQLKTRLAIKRTPLATWKEGVRHLE